MTMSTQPTSPHVVAIDMGYGHMRAAAALAQALGSTTLHVDRAPLADAGEQRRWATSRRVYEALSRGSQLTGIGRPLRAVLNTLTSIAPLYPSRDLSAPHAGVRWLHHLAQEGLGRGLVERLREAQAPLLTTFYAPAVLADYHGYERIYCVVTDVDINRVWAPMVPQNTRIQYFAPSPRAVHRLQAFGVPAERIAFTGFPLPDALVGGLALHALRQNLRDRLVRLDPSMAFRTTHRAEIQAHLGALPEVTAAPHLTFAVGGAGAQADLARRFLPSMAPALRDGRLRLCLVAGVRQPIAAQFAQWVDDAGLTPQLNKSIEILCEPTLETYFQRFNAVLARTDVLWTKPSELTFFAALGLPLVTAWPMGVHEVYNRRWAMENGAALKQRDPSVAYAWLNEWLNDGTLARAAWSGFMNLPKVGLYRILERLG